MAFAWVPAELDGGDKHARMAGIGSKDKYCQEQNVAVSFGSTVIQGAGLFSLTEN